MRLALVALSALSLAACAGSEDEAPVQVAAARGERLTLALRTVEDLKPVAARVGARDTAEARARIGGTLVELRVREGDVVRRGQVLALVADRRLAQETAAYDAQAAAAAAEDVRAQAELARVRTLHDKGFYAPARLEQAQAAARAASELARAARAQRSASAEMIDQGAIVAPADGRVLTADIPTGAVVTPGQTVVTLTAGPPVLRIELPEAQGRGLAGGQAVRLGADAPAGVAATGVVAQVYPAVRAGMVVADVQVAGLKADLVGQRVTLQVRAGERQALVIPARFVSTRFGLDFVRLAKDGAEVPVQLAPGPAAGEVEVLSGLRPGDVILAPGPAR